MRNIVIVSKVVVGARPNPFGIDRGLNIFKKSYSKTLESHLNQIFLEKGLDYKASVDSTYDSLTELIQNGARLLLISPYIKEYVDVHILNNDRYYILSEEEFNNGYTENIIAFLKEMN
ncbi:hypothetical protein ACQCVH_08485 [Bacillus infantis]|uniref:hypothetical protein n=1 Tax=Bacillus infantis TaxID=324767 RepID=UPI003CF26EBD